MPMKTQLEKSIIKNYAQLALTKYQSLEYVINQRVDDAELISTRTVIRDNIVEYKNQEIKLSELREFTQPKYEERCLVIDNLLIAERFVDGVSIARVEKQPIDDYQNTLGESLSDEMELTVEVFQKQVLLRIVSPILKNGEVLGYDFFLYDLTNMLESLSDNHYQVSIEEREMATWEKERKILYLSNNLRIREEDGLVFAEVLLGQDKAFKIQTNEKELYRDMSQLVMGEVVLWGCIFILLLSMVYLFLFRIADKRIRQIQKSRDEYKGMAYKDTLTGAYSKAFIEVWNESIRTDAQFYTLVVVDLDRFKSVNDEYGHLKGDEALLSVAKVIQEATRLGDYIIRFGGDEFLILFKNIKEKQAYDIMKRIEKNVKKQNQLEFDINISYGISIINAHDNFEDQFHLADQRMYSNKKQKALI